MLNSNDPRKSQIASDRCWRMLLEADYEKAIAIPRIKELLDRARQEWERCQGDVDDEMIEAWNDTEEIVEYAKRGDITPIQLWAIEVFEFDGWEAAGEYLNEVGFDYESLREKAYALAA